MSRLRAFIVLLLALSGAGVVLAIDDATLRIARVEGAGFQARDIAARMQITDAGLRLEARLGEVTLRGGAQRVRNVRIACPALTLTAARIGCAQADIAAALPVLGEQRLRAALEYGRIDGSLRVALQNVRIGAGQGQLQLALVGERWHAVAKLREVAVQPLLELVRTSAVSLSQIAGTGVVSFDVEAEGGNAAELTIASVRLAGGARELTLNNESGTLASDKLQLDVEVRLGRRNTDWTVETQLRATAGQAYFEPVFLDFGAHALTASARGAWTDDGVLTLERFALDHRDVLQASGAVELVPALEQPVRALQLNLERLQFPGAYESYLQPYLVNTSFESMTTSGSLAGEIVIGDGLPRAADLRFAALSFDDGNRSLALRELQGNWHWRNESAAAAPASLLKFTGGTLLGLELGGSELQFVTSERNVRLLQTARIPVFDGAIELESFRVRNLATPSVAFIVDATIHPISVAQLCRAFGWPEFGGQIGGVISKLRLRDGVMTLGTTLEARVFDGKVSLSDLRLEDALGQWPRFFANVGLENLDLELVTQAFSFGRITGRLSGSVRELRLFNWTPVSFDAALYTPPDDRSRHRISQRAVANIGNLGGGGAGVTAALSSGFLKFFEDFNYDRLGLSCRLQNEVCYMSGVMPAPHGAYYLVKGKGVPRIDVIAAARRVDWPRLVAQLKAATESGGPSVR